jgi:uncharacterized membrane protein
MSTTAQTLGYVCGGTLVTAEVGSIIALAFFREAIARKFPRFVYHMGVGVKTTSYRFCAGLDTFLVALLVTGNPWASTGIVGFELMTKFFLYYGHEWVWNRPFLAKYVRAVEKQGAH